MEVSIQVHPSTISININYSTEFNMNPAAPNGGVIKYI